MNLLTWIKRNRVLAISLLIFLVVLAIIGLVVVSIIILVVVIIVILLIRKKSKLEKLRLEFNENIREEIEEEYPTSEFLTEEESREMEMAENRVDKIYAIKWKYIKRVMKTLDMNEHKRYIGKGIMYVPVGMSGMTPMFEFLSSINIKDDPLNNNYPIIKLSNLWREEEPKLGEIVKKLSKDDIDKLLKLTRIYQLKSTEYFGDDVGKLMQILASRITGHEWEFAYNQSMVNKRNNYAKNLLKLHNAYLWELKDVMEEEL